MARSYDYQEHKFYHEPNNVPTRSNFSSANSKIADLPLELLYSIY